MPFYEYMCEACGHEFEEFQKITDKPVRTCPECGKRRVKRLISQTSFVLKGSGWYVTDYAKKPGSDKDERKEPALAGKKDGSKDSKKDKKSPASTSAG
jgi:putative FmdB family regulatory protein